MEASLPRGTHVWILISRVGRLPRLWLSYAAVLALTGKTGRRAALDALLAGIVTDRIVAWILKPIFRRPRPVGEVRWRDTPSDASFPSSHAANGFAFVTAVGYAFPSLRTPSYVVAAAVALSRIALRHHYVSDVIVGAGVGHGIARALHMVPPRDK